MSLLLARRMSSKAAGVGKSLIGRGIRFLTTTHSLPSSPYLLLPMDVVGDSPGGKLVNFNLYDLEKKKRVTIEKQRIPESIYISRTIGSSRGWLIRINNEDLTVHLTNMLNPSAPKSIHKVISLPPILPLPHSLDPSESTPLAELVRSVSLSSSPDQPDCVLVIKFWGSCTSFCSRLGGGSWSWRHINYLSFEDFEDSTIIYSNAASIFYLTPNELASRNFDLEINFELYKDELEVGQKDDHHFHGFPLVVYFMHLQPFQRPRDLSDSEYELMRAGSGSFSGQRFLVEAPSGQIFTIISYMKTWRKHDIGFCYKESDPYVVKTYMFELYKHQKRVRVGSYVRDIGDLCIFFGKNEPFFVPATMYPGLKPNSIYFTEMNKICVYDIATRTIHQFPHQERLLTPFWLSPIPHK